MIPRALEIFKLRLANIDEAEAELSERKRRVFHEIGMGLRIFRESRNVSLREVARIAKLSAPFVSDVELGRRRINSVLLEAYAKAEKLK